MEKNNSKEKLGKDTEKEPKAIPFEPSKDTKTEPSEPSEDGEEIARTILIEGSQ